MGFGLNAPGFEVKVTGPQAAKGSNIPVEQEIVDTWAKVMDDSDPLTWVISKYKAGRLPLETGNGLELLAAGEGGLTAFKEALPQNDLAWGAFRIQAVDKRGELESKRPKFIFVHYACENVSQIRKAKMAVHKSDAKHAFIDCHIDIMIEKPDDLEEQDLMNRLQAAAGAHKPNGYEFDEGVFLESDYYGLGIGEKCKGESADKQAQPGNAEAESGDKQAQPGDADADESAEYQPQPSSSSNNMLPFLAVGRVKDAVTLSHYINTETYAEEQTMDIFKKLLLASSSKLSAGQRTSLQWNDGRVCCLMDSKGENLYCVVTSLLTYPERLAYQLLFDLVAQASQEPDLATAPEHGLNDRFQLKMKDMVLCYEEKYQPQPGTAAAESDTDEDESAEHQPQPGDADAAEIAEDQAQPRADAAESADTQAEPDNADAPRIVVTKEAGPGAFEMDAGLWADLAREAPFLAHAFKLHSDTEKTMMAASQCFVDEDIEQMGKQEEEFTKQHEAMVENCQGLFAKSFDHHDKNGDGVLSKDEAAVFFEHFMDAHVLSVESMMEDGPHQLIMQEMMDSGTFEEEVRAERERIAKKMEDYKAHKTKRNAAAFAVVDKSGERTLKRDNFLECVSFDSYMNSRFMDALGLINH